MNKFSLKLQLLSWLIPCWLTAQIPPEKNPFPTEEFVVYQTLKDSIQNVQYQIGRREPKEFTFDHGAEGWTQVPLDEKSKNNQNFFHTYAPAYLKITTKNTENYYFLDDYYDIDMYAFTQLKSENLIFITARYSLYIIDKKNLSVSKKVIPGQGQYEGEDAISGLYSALTLFDNEKFLLGNVQGFSVFCLDVSNPDQPFELKQYSNSLFNEGQFYAFFHQKNNDQFDLILAQTDAKSDEKTVKRLYKKLKNIHYVLKNTTLEINSSGEPIVEISEEKLQFDSSKVQYTLELKNGTLSQEKH